jgi:ribosome-associated toxin RatA of RatAB toxin-antitoxin module
MATEDSEQATSDEERDGAGQNGGGSAAGVLSALKSKEILIPAAISAVGAVAASSGPDLLRKLTQSTEEKGEEGVKKLGEKALEGAKDSLGGGGGVGGLAGKAVSKALGGGGGGGGGSGGKKTRRLPIQRWTDVAVPVDKAYDAWLAFDKYPQFMHRVLNVEKKGNDKVQWQEKIWFSKRQWEGRVTEKRKNDRIAWKTTNGMSHKGVVSFHKLDSNLTRVMVTMEFEPNGMMEKMASGLRFVKRAVQADLARFKAYVEMEDAKGIEYRPVREDDDERDEREPSGDSGERGRQNGGGDDAEREKERRERQSRRDERRETAGAS